MAECHHDTRPEEEGFIPNLAVTMAQSQPQAPTRYCATTFLSHGSHVNSNRVRASYLRHQRRSVESFISSSTDSYLDTTVPWSCAQFPYVYRSSVDRIYIPQLLDRVYGFLLCTDLLLLGFYQIVSPLLSVRL
jgi:hypothetical protein